MKRLLVIGAVLFMLLPLTALAQDTCEGNFDCDQDVDGTDASVFKSDFGRSQFKNPCPACAPAGCEYPAPVPKTRQTTVYATGDDGDLEKGVAWPNPRFADNGTGTVTDNLTGLIWLKNANCYGQRTWNQALSDCNGLNNGECGLTDSSVAGDWRLSNVKEMQSLIDFSQYEPALPSGHPFSSVQNIQYWSSTTHPRNSGVNAWYVGMGNGYMYDASKTSTYYVWCVRGGSTTTTIPFGQPCDSFYDCGPPFGCCCLIQGSTCQDFMSCGMGAGCMMP